ncbi:MAG: PAS domain S-box protein [Candidatus Aminicenantes bacterium]|nr:MAG: PAS domain S-box protein [Candidatus Aminicenantes bacterium]
MNKRDNEIKRLHSQLGEIREELSASEVRFQNIIGKSKDGVLILDQQGVIIYANPSAQVILNQNIEKIIGEQFGILIEGDYESEISILSSKASPRIVELRVSAIEWNNKPFSLVFINDITRRKLAESRLKTALEEKEVLLKEVYHRVKNNLHIISSLLDIQELRLKDTAAADAFRECKNRVIAMSLIHEKLYQARDLSRVNFREYIQSLIMHLFKSYLLEPGKVRLKMEVKEILLNLDTAIHLGLIINELVSNSLKYAFPGKRKGTIEVYLDKINGEEDKNILIISDNGVGISESVDLQCDSHLGMRIIHSLVKKLRGDIDIDGKDGATFTIKFKELK